MKQIHVRLKFFEEMLGTANSDPEIHERFIASKAPDAKSREEEVASLGVDEVVERGKTVFHKTEDGRPYLFDYMVRGFFKTAGKVCYQLGGKHKLTAYKSKIDTLVFIKERRILLQMPVGTTLGNLQRPLRAQTAQGERVSLANSETAPVGTEIEFTIITLLDELEEHILEWLDYGKYSGIGQWRNSGCGRFLYEELDDKGQCIGGNMNEWDSFVQGNLDVSA